MSILATAYYCKKNTFKQPLIHAILFLLKWLKHPGLKVGEKKNRENWKKPSLVSNTNLHYYLISEQILVQQASWYTENPATTLLIHLLPQHGTNHGHSAKIWEQTLPWSNQWRKTNLFTTCWQIQATTTMDGLGCIGKLMTNFIGLIAALRGETLATGPEANQVKVAAMRIVCILRKTTLVENGMTEYALTQTPLPSASG